MFNVNPMGRLRGMVAISYSHTKPKKRAADNGKNVQNTKRLRIRTTNTTTTNITTVLVDHYNTLDVIVDLSEGES